MQGVLKGLIGPVCYVRVDDVVMDRQMGRSLYAAAHKEIF